MKTRKVKHDGRRWLTPWHFAVFAMGAVAGSILGGFYGAAYTSAAVIVTCWFTALMLVAFDRSRIRAPRSATPGRRWQTPMRASGGASDAPAPPVGRRGAGAALSLDAARRSRLRTIAGGKSEPPWRAS
jgi:predicted lipid-binding transport protein (Tim44 family)